MSISGVIDMEMNSNPTLSVFKNYTKHICAFDIFTDCAFSRADNTCNLHKRNAEQVF